MKNKEKKQNIISGNYWEMSKIWDMVEDEIDKFIISNQSKCDVIRQQGWFGEKIKRCHQGFLGYLRMSFALQIKILNEIDNPLPIYSRHATIVNFFRGDFFKNEVRKAGKVQAFYKREHLELIKNDKE